jgi:hypothetical protein
LLGAAYALSGRGDGAIARLEEAQEERPAMRLMALQSLVAGWLCVGYLAADRVDAAASLAREALDHSRQRQDRGDHAWSLWLSGEVASRRDHADVVTVEGLYRQALDQASHLGMRPLAALCRLALGRLYRSAQSVEADVELRAAAALLSEMDMAPWAMRVPQETTRRECSRSLSP